MVCFNPLKHEWAADLITRSWIDKSSNGASASVLMIQDGRAGAWNAMGHWIEREGRKWEDSGAFFAVKIAAAGWYSAALVLVDKGEMEAMRQSHVMSRDQQIQGKRGIVRTAHRIGYRMFRLGRRVRA